MLLAQEIIRKKRNGEELSSSELSDFFHSYLEGRVADYQVSAMLMAIYFKGMTPDEVAALTQLMQASGKQFRWEFADHLLVDKHSTGGIGDKTSLIILPLALLAGLKVPMIAGRGLGHTGGTLDKLEAVGTNVFPTSSQVTKQLQELGGIFMGQTDEIVPLDKQLYSLRDVTATVESIPLIVASILSKKLASGVKSLVMDVKFGSGAFMSEYPQAKKLAQALCDVAGVCGMKLTAFLTSMNNPLGTTAGNALEVHEVLEVLDGKGPQDTRDLSLELTTAMVHAAFPVRSVKEIRAELDRFIDSGAAKEMFIKIMAKQGADVSLLENPSSLLRASIRKPCLNQSKETHFVQSIDVRALGLAVVALGGGRNLSSDSIDPWVGLTSLKHCGDRVEPGQAYAEVHGNRIDQVEKAVALITQAYTFSSQPVAPQPLIHERLANSL